MPMTANGDQDGPRDGPPLRLLNLLNRSMPLNVEERFWTATVLPALVAAPNLEPLGGLLKLMRERAGVSEPGEAYDPSRVIFFTEFDRRKSNGKGCGRDLSDTSRNATPDVVIVELGADPLIYGIEGKMAGCVNSLRWQRLQQTRFVLNGLRRDLETESGKPVAAPIHVALVPEERQPALKGQRVPVISWTEILHLTKLPPDDYFVQCLTLMTQRYSTIASAKAKTWEGEYTGRQLKWLARRDPEFRPRFVGIGQGARGERFSDLIASGGWKRYHFQANWTADWGASPNGNWISYDEFLRRVHA